MRILLATILLLCAAAAPADIITREVTYPAGDVTAKGFLAAPDDGKQHPGVLIIHEWWGQNDYTRKRARMLAELGYTALAVDMYGDGKTATHPKDAGTFAMMVKNNQPEMKARFRGAMKFLRAQKEVAPGDIAAIGYCFGGNVVLQMARNGQKNLAGVASFHGSLNLREPNPPARIKARVLVCNGAEDPFIPASDIEAFKELMKQHKADLKFVNYPGAFHAFTNKDATAIGEQFGLSLKYDAKADRASWNELQDFLATVFQDDDAEPEANDTSTTTPD